MVDRLKRLVKVLASPDSDLADGWWVGEIYIDCISIIDDEVIFCIWDGSYEHQFNASDVEEHYLEKLIKKLEEML